MSFNYNRKILIPARKSLNTVDRSQISNNPIPLRRNETVKRCCESNSFDEPPIKRSLVRHSLPNRISYEYQDQSPSSQRHNSSYNPITRSSADGNFANRRLQNLRKNIEERRPEMEKLIKSRLNKSNDNRDTNINSKLNIVNSSSVNSTFVEKEITPSNSSTTLLQARLKLYKYSTGTLNVQSPVTTHTNQSIDQEFDNSMEWVPIDEATILSNINEVRKEIDYNKKLLIIDLLNDAAVPSTSSSGVFVVVDTNIFISHLNVISHLQTTEFAEFGRVTIVVPWMVIQELDYMKESKESQIYRNARKAVGYINEQLTKKDPYFKGQTVLEASKLELSSNNADDGILHCCLQLMEEQKCVILLSNDVNLRNKALVHKVRAYHSNEMINNLHNLKITETIADSNRKKLDKVKITFTNLLSHVVESEMRKAYDNIWLRIVKNPPPYTIEEALNIIIKYWISVFSFSLQKQAQHKIDEFLTFLRKHKQVLDETVPDEIFNKFVEFALSLCIYLKNGYPCYKILITDCIKNIQSCATID